ncbi:thermonuclease family protein [Hoeflea sp.]|uniref:thermonuclease family protein n=1 Tax=Hoeflea sp. TaxID=1940281 RepID=UPI003B5217DC
MIRSLLAVAALAAFCAPAASDPACGLYQYKAEIVRVIDGDTVVADIDLGFNTWRRDEHLRLYGIDTPERRKATMDGWRAAKAALAQRIEGRELIICTIKNKRGDEDVGKYGRYLVKIYDGEDLVNDWMLEQGLAVVYED